MTTRKELIDQARADQRTRSARARADNPKSAIVGIGDRDPLTGQYQVMLPDGSVETGEKQFNSSLPKGNQVLGVPQSGGWLLDERDVQPIKPTLQPSMGGKIKVLYSQIEGEERVFYLWGDRALPKRICSIPSYVYNFRAKIDNRGNGDLYTVGIQVFYSDLVTRRILSFGDDRWEYESTFVVALLGFSYDESRNLGHGFWTEVIPRLYAPLYVAPVGSYQINPVQPVQPTFYSLHKGVRTDHLASVQIEFRSDNVVTKSVYLKHQPILPGVTISEYGILEMESVPGAGNVGSLLFVKPIVVSKDLKSVVYFESFSPTYGGSDNTFQYKLKTSSAEIVLGGEYSFVSFEGDQYFGNLIGSRLFRVQIPGNNSVSRWSVDIYNLGVNCTKSTIKAKVTYKQETGMTFHNASYHP